MTEDIDRVIRCARLALACVQREYPNKIVHLLRNDGDVLPPRRLTPAFFGAFDWHSAVHGHWALARLLACFPEAPLAAEAAAALDRTLTAERIDGEIRYQSTAGREGFECPYGAAWLLQLASELRAIPDGSGKAWSATLEPLEARVAVRLHRWLERLPHPIRSGEHSQSAFAMALALDWAREGANADETSFFAERARELYLADREAPIDYEPSGHDFLSPALAEADLLRRVLPEAELASWLGAFLPRIPEDGGPGWLGPVSSVDPADGKLAHLDGLNLSRAWMLEGIASALPSRDPRRDALLASAAEHRRAGLASIHAEHYAGAHWLGSFAIYLLTRRGLT